jgi:hypothetical protein
LKQSADRHRDRDRATARAIRLIDGTIAPTHAAMAAAIAGIGET